MHPPPLDSDRRTPWTRLALGIAALAAIVGLDLLLGVNEAVVGAAIITVAAVIAGLAARTTATAKAGIFRLRLLDRVGRIADGSPALSETLDRVTEAVVPAFADLCMIDTIHEGDVRRIGVRACGADAKRIETAVRNRTPSTPEWLSDPESDSLEPHFVASMPDEVLRQMANDSDDLEFLRGLGPNSYIVAPLVSRGRSLGALTVVRVGRSPSLDRGEVEFVTVLASRIGVALDNAGLFSDLESIERRMDSVMSNISEAVMVHDGSGALVYANDAAAGLAGADELEPLGTQGRAGDAPGLEVRDEAGRPLDPEMLPRRRTLRGEPAEPQVIGVRDLETGHDSWLLERSTAITDHSDQVLYVVTTVQDVTAVKGAESSQRLLADAADAIASAADYEAALSALALAVVPQLADWCSVSVPGADGSIEQVAVSESDPEMIELDNRLREGLQVRPGTRLSMTEVLQASRPATAELTSGPTRGSVLLKPIRAGGDAIGLLTLINREGRPLFSTEEIQLARAVADRAGVAILNAKLATERAAIAETLQRALLPPILPEVSGWSIAAMYRPAGEVTRAGGDFYDVFEGRDGWVVVLGDVEGHGAEAAALTGMVRHTVRTAAMIDGDLLKAFGIINRQLRATDRPRLCSVVCVSFGSSAEVTVVSAGHPLPLLVCGGVTQEVGLPGSLLGALANPEWSPVGFTVEDGDELVVYTDGVVEARRNDDRFGRERLTALLRRASGPADVVQRVGEAIEGFAEAVHDDAALLVMRRDGRADAGTRHAQIRQEIG